MLSLTDPRWSQFQANYTNGRTVADLLSRVDSGESLDRWYDDLFQELCHQYTVCEAAYPAAPHLVHMATVHERHRKALLVLLGACHAFAEPSQTRALPDDIKEAWQRSARDAIPLLADLVAQPQPSTSDFVYLLCALAAVSGYPSLARAIVAIDYIEEG